MRALFLLSIAVACSACELIPRKLPRESPPLFDMEEPLELRAEPQDETERATLDPGSFTGIYTSDSRQSLDALMAEPEGVLVARVVENSPADVAGIEAGDLLLEARVGDTTTALHWPSEWRKIELETKADAEIELVYDRAGAEMRAKLVTVKRARPTDRAEALRFREDEKVGVVVRNATEVEARAAGLGPGGGAVIVGLARSSPWRKDGLVHSDCITRVDGVEVAHPEVLLGAIRAADDDAKLELEYLRGGEMRHVEVHVSSRAQELTEFSIPLIFSYSDDRGHTETSFLFGLYSHESTKAAWKTRLLWFITFSGGDSDRLEEEQS
jgi:C-terminal processing protease CtpA/Prc